MKLQEIQELINKCSSKEELDRLFQEKGIDLNDLKIEMSDDVLNEITGGVTCCLSNNLPDQSGINQEGSSGDRFGAASKVGVASSVGTLENGSILDVGAYIEGLIDTKFGNSSTDLSGNMSRGASQSHNADK